MPEARARSIRLNTAALNTTVTISAWLDTWYATRLLNNSEGRIG
jgi:hypothetical protein